MRINISANVKGRVQKMKRKILAVLLMIAMVFLVLSGCSKDNESSSGASDSDTIYGEVSAIDDGSITIKVGTMNMEKRDGEKPSEGESMSEMETPGEGETPDMSNREVSSIIELTGETKEIKFADSIVAREQKMGGFGRGGMGGFKEMPTGEDGETMKIPSGENDERPEVPTDENGEMPEFPSGENGQGAPPEMPTGEDGSMLERPSGEEQGGFSQMAAKIELSDVSVGDIVAITLDEDGNAKDILVYSFEEFKEEA